MFTISSHQLNPTTTISQISVFQSPATTADLIQTALDYSTSTPAAAKRDKDPKLMDLLYRSFQAKLARGDFNHKKQLQGHLEKPSTLTKPPTPSAKFQTMKPPPKVPNHVTMTMTSHLQQQQPQRQYTHLGHEHQQHVQHHHHAMNSISSICSTNATLSSLTSPTSVITTSPYASTELVVSNSTTPSVSAAAVQSYNYNAQIAFLQQQQQQQQQNLLNTLSQHPFYAAAFQAASPSAAAAAAASLFAMPTQFVWPTASAQQLGVAASASSAPNFAAAYQAMPSPGALMTQDNYALFQSNPYLATASVSLKRPHQGDYDADGSKRLRLAATIPF